MKPGSASTRRSSGLPIPPKPKNAIRRSARRRLIAVALSVAAVANAVTAIVGAVDALARRATPLGPSGPSVHIVIVETPEILARDTGAGQLPARPASGFRTHVLLVHQEDIQ